MLDEVMTLGDSVTYLADESPYMHLDCGEIHMHDAPCFPVTCAYTHVYTEQEQNNTHINITKTGTGDAACNMLWNIMHDQKGSFNTLQRFCILCLFACNDKSH